MTIHYVLLKNHLVDDPDACCAKVQFSRTATMEELIDDIVDRGSTVVRSDILSVLDDFHRSIERMVLDGKTVVTPMAIFRTSIKGVFAGPEDPFDPTRHRVVPRVAPGRRFRKAIRTHARVAWQESVEPAPNLIKYYDLNSGTGDDQLTPGGVGRVFGRRLQFDEADPEQGVFFVTADNGATRSDFVIRNKPSELHFLVPTLPAGEYTLQVRAMIKGSDEVRTGTLKPKLTVAA